MFLIVLPTKKVLDHPVVFYHFFKLSTQCLVVFVFLMLVFSCGWQHAPVRFSCELKIE
jgi:hypothetical protein